MQFVEQMHGLFPMLFGLRDTRSVDCDKKRVRAFHRASSFRINLQADSKLLLETLEAKARCLGAWPYDSDLALA